MTRIALMSEPRYVVGSIGRPFFGAQVADMKTGEVSPRIWSIELHGYAISFTFLEPVSFVDWPIPEVISDGPMSFISLRYRLLRSAVEFEAGFEL